MRGRRLRRIGATLVALAGLTVIVALASGEVALVTTHGISMEPRFHTGDLAVIVPGSPYRVGEIVGYHSPLLDTTVLHRIVAEHDGLFTFKGDHNSFLDPQKLPASDIKGRLWLHIPHGGEVLARLRSPVVLGFLAFVFVAVGLGRVSRHRRSRGSLAGPGSSRSGPKHAVPPPEAVAWWPLATAGVVVAIFAVLSLATWLRPATRPSELAVPYDQRVSFSYSADAPEGVTYPTGVVTTGDPVFPRLVSTLDVMARYSISGSGATGLSGTIGADAVLEGPRGWSSPLGSVAPVAFSGANAHVEIPVDLGQVVDVEKQFEAETGTAIDYPQIAVTPTVHVDGRIDGSPIAATYAPSLDVADNGVEIDLGSAGAGASSDQAAGLTQESPGKVELASRTQTKVTVFGRILAVSAARRLALVGLLLSIVGALGACWWVIRRRRMDETDLIRAAYGHDLVEVSSSPAAHARLVVDVQSFAALARLARRYDCVILDLEHAGGHAYFVECGATIYRHGPDPAAGLSAVDPTTVDFAATVDPTTVDLAATVDPTAVDFEPVRMPASVPDGPMDLTYYVRSVSSAS